MNTREQFGKYLLLKKLTEDPLGETFRAGMLGDKGMDRVVLLRIFNGQGVDGNRLWQATEGRVGVQEILRSPNIGEGVDLGEIEGLPFVAYDYVSGKNLATLLEQAARQRNFIPPEHALLITERVALALAAASENRYQGERVLHGFLSPHLVMISNEGETRLLGFEVSTGLRGFAANPVIRQHFGRYLAPEALAGSPLHPSDDIYSLGVVLFELLTGRPLPPPGPDGFGSVIERGVVATEGGPIAPELQSLLKQSLVPREQRIADVPTWHKTLNQWMVGGQYNPTTFNLAFFMHNLFRQDIERESKEIEVERTLPLPVQRPAAATASAAVATAEAPAAAPTATPTAVGEGTDVREATATDIKTENFIPEYAKEDKKSKTGLYIGVAVALLALVALGAFFMSGSGGESSAEAAASPPPPPPPVVEEPSGPTEEELQAQIADMISKRASEMEEELKKNYDQQLEDLQSQLAKAQREAEERQAREKELEEQRIKEAEEAEAAAEAERLAQIAAEEEAARKAEEEAAAAAEEPVEVAEQTPPPPPPAVVAPPPPPPRAPQVRRGDLVKLGPGVTPPKVVRRPQPRFPQMAKRFNRREAKVELRVLVDETGKVLKAELQGKKQGYGFDEEALSAAKKSTYRPATKDGVPVKVWHNLSVEFRER